MYVHTLKKCCHGNASCDREYPIMNVFPITMMSNYEYTKPKYRISTANICFLQAELKNLRHIPGVNPAFLTPSSHLTHTASRPPTLTPPQPPPPLTLQDIEAESKTVEPECDDTDMPTLLPLVPPPDKTDPPSLDSLFVSHTCLQ